MAVPGYADEDITQILAVDQMETSFQNSLDISIVIKDTADAVNVKNLTFNESQLDSFVKNEPKERKFVFAIGYFKDGILSISATRNPFQPVLLDKYNIL